MERYLIIGHITRPHGVHGEVKVRPETDFPDRFTELARILLVRAGEGAEPPAALEPVRSAAVESVRRQGELILLKLGGIDDLTAARGLQGLAVAVPWAERVPLPAGTYYVAQLVGLSVRTIAGEVLGRIAEVVRTPANDVYRVSGQGGDLLIPATREVVRDIDLEVGEVVVDLPAGLRAEEGPHAD